LFIADIQEFYELTLLDESKSIQQKTAETLLIASKWEHENSKTEVRTYNTLNTIFAPSHSHFYSIKIISSSCVKSIFFSFLNCLKKSSQVVIVVTNVNKS
jgi:hypothetical protein